MNDIETFEDCLFLIEKFYTKLLLSDIAHYFVDLNLKKHIPKVADFWAFILIDKPGYNNNMMNAHASLDLNENDFSVWLELFHQTVSENFEGPKAKLAIDRSNLIAWTMKSKLL